jgi:NADPH2:quinone reductase
MRGLVSAFAVAGMIQGMTAVAFGTIAYPIKAGDTVLVHAAAGGTGQLLTQV